MHQVLALGLTLVIECSVAWGFLRRRSPTDRRLVLLFVGGVNLVTHPIAWTVHANLTLPSFVAFGVIEGAVVLVEAAALRCLPGMTTVRAAAMSLSMNAISASVGVILF